MVPKPDGYYWDETGKSAYVYSHKEVWLERHPRVHFHFFPTSTSWLNLVERFFSEITTRQIRPPAVHSVAELEEAITTYIDLRNQDPKPFTWTASADLILEKVRRGNKTFEALH